MVKILWYNKSIITSIILLFILIFLFIATQGILWYIINIVLYITILINCWFFCIKLKTHYRFTFRKKAKKQKEISDFGKKILRTLLTFLIVIMLILSYILFMFVTPYIKGSMNEGYLHEVVAEITEGKNTDQEKIGALLNWFDRNSDNMYNSWFLVKENKVLLTLIPNHFYILTEMPYFGVRCPEDKDGKWILTSRFGACGEYSRVFMYMADSMEIDVRRVHAPGEDHLWNEVLIDGEWIPVDPTNVSLPDADGWEDYGFFEYKEGNASYIWAEYLKNDTIEDLTSLYTKLTNITLNCVDENNNSISDLTITVMSNNLHDVNRIHETYIKNKPKPKTNETGYCTFQIGGGTYKFKANNDEFTGETEWVEFSDNITQHDFIIILKEK